MEERGRGTREIGSVGRYYFKNKTARKKVPKLPKVRVQKPKPREKQTERAVLAG